MITGDDIRRLREESQEEKRTLVVDTLQFFEIEIPADKDPEEYVNSTECKLECAKQILDGDIELDLDHIK